MLTNKKKFLTKFLHLLICHAIAIGVCSIFFCGLSSCTNAKSLELEWESTQKTLEKIDSNALVVFENDASKDNKEIEVKIKNEYSCEWALNSVSYYFKNSKGQTTEETIVYDAFNSDKKFDYRITSIKCSLNFAIKKRDIPRGFKICVKAFVSRWFKVTFNEIINLKAKIYYYGRSGIMNWCSLVRKNSDDTGIKIIYDFRYDKVDLQQKEVVTLDAEFDQQNITSDEATIEIDREKEKITLIVKPNFISKLKDNLLTINILIDLKEI